MPTTPPTRGSRRITTRCQPNRVSSSANAWSDIFGDTTIAAAMLDRLLHRCAVINITGDSDSYRLRAHQARNRQHTTTIQPPQSEESR